jgi:hypothetical protein
VAGVAGFIVSFPLQEQIFPAIKADLMLPQFSNNFICRYLGYMNDHHLSSN